MPSVHLVVGLISLLVAQQASFRKRCRARRKQEITRRRGGIPDPQRPYTHCTSYLFRRDSDESLRQRKGYARFYPEGSDLFKSLSKLFR
ncbi:D-alanyl-D-alanine dipeptidase [Pseudomonas syringae pv. actinidiae]|uniref:D-alanyl-D-alanine dipeptidase n=1 Tax=Pseudomonas syringae pv. actinidiae TaxID=103796 RepID=A0AAN4Q861_PSESF|nr:D-alanyl-D-alanine dipeptidase [Pseudomonas syringae pv. actinidiae]